MRGSRLLSVLALCVIATVALARGHGHRTAAGATGQFDYYLMSLSWSPSYCATHPGDQRQCRHKGYGFVLHGLWPQGRNGLGPENCRTDAIPDDAVIQRALAFMPSQHLIEHEWQTHGSCSGLDPAEYFGLADRAFASVKIPPALTTPRSPPSMTANDVRQAFLHANPGLGNSMLSIVCHDGDELTEVRVCLNKGTLAAQACTGPVRNSCRYGKLQIPALRQ
ncbi:MAG: ribonuclease T2 family protein [Rudaea sp.]